MNHEIIAISITSLLRIVPLAFLALGILIGFYTFFIKPSKTARELNAKSRLYAYLIFSILYPFLMAGAVVLLGLVYNILTIWMPGIEVTIK